MERMAVPQWSPIAEPDDWGAFAQLIADEVAARGWTVDLAEGWAYDGDVQFGLFNVAGKCRQVERALWPEVVSEHFASIAATAARSALADVPGFTNADEARASMKARLVSDAYKQDTGADLLELRVAEDLVAVVAYDLPENVMLPERADVLRYGDERELLELALRQAREEPGLALVQHELNGAPLYVLTGESFFTATHALWADRFSEQPAELGTLVGVPTRHMVVAHPIRDRGALTVIAKMLQLVPAPSTTGPGSLSDGLYWLLDGRMERLETWIDEQGPHPRPHRASRACSRRWPASAPDPERCRADSVAALAPYGFALPPHFPLLGDEDVGAQRPLEQVVARAQALVACQRGARRVAGEGPARARRAWPRSAGSARPSGRSWTIPPTTRRAAADLARRGPVRADVGLGGGGRIAAGGQSSASARSSWARSIRSRRCRRRRRCTTRHGRGAAGPVLLRALGRAREPPQGRVRPRRPTRSSAARSRAPARARADSRPPRSADDVSAGHLGPDRRT